MMGEAETVGEAQTVLRWYSGWGAMEETPERLGGDTDWQSSQTSYGGGDVVKRK